MPKNPSEVEAEAPEAPPTAALSARAALRCVLTRSAALLAVLFLSLTFSACSMQTDTFDSAQWKSQRGVAALDNKRGGMVDKLEANVRVGMSRAEVVALLGEPDSGKETGVEKYMLGLAMGPDEQYYEIRYSEGKVESLRLGQF